MVVAPLVFPGIAAGSIFTFSLSLGDYIAVTIVGGKTQTARQHHLRPAGHRQQPAAGGGAVDHPAGRDHRLPAGDAPHRRAGERLMLSTGARRAVRAWTVLVLVFLYAPLLLVVVNAFNASRTFAFPPSGFTLQWWVAACEQRGHVEVAGQFGGGRPRRDGRSRLCSARWPRSRCSATRSSAATLSVSLWCCRLRCRASSPASRSTRRSPRRWA